MFLLPGFVFKYYVTPTGNRWIGLEASCLHLEKNCRSRTLTLNHTWGQASWLAKDWQDVDALCATGCLKDWWWWNQERIRNNFKPNTKDKLVCGDVQILFTKYGNFLVLLVQFIQFGEMIGWISRLPPIKWLQSRWQNLCLSVNNY